jgi:hypothetical protein
MKNTPIQTILLISLVLSSLACEKKDKSSPEGDQKIEIASARVGQVSLSTSETTGNVPVDKPVVLSFSQPLDTGTVQDNIELLRDGSQALDLKPFFFEDHKRVSLTPEKELKYNTPYVLRIGEGLKGAGGASFSGAEYRFSTQNGTLQIRSVTLNDKDFSRGYNLRDIDFQTRFRVHFNAPVERENASQNISLSRANKTIPLEVSFANGDSTLVIDNQEQLDYYLNYTFHLERDLTTPGGFDFEGFQNDFYTRLDSTDKFPRISEEALLTKIQEQTFKYFWDFGHPESGMARERNTSDETVTGGGSAFGIMSIIVGIERGFITRDQGLQRMQKILNFLENEADRFHGAWPHWMNGSTGEVIPFSEKDDGGDLVEAGFMAQALLTFRQYLEPSVPEEQAMIDQINTIWEGIEWDWYTKNGEENVLYWHWSPNYGFEKDLPIRGHNETQIIYVMAASSPTHPIDAEVYHHGYARDGGIINGNSYYGHTLPVGNAYGGPLFFTHYSYLGLDPRNLEDDYADYWKQNRNHALIHWEYCKDNPNNYIGYGEDSWGLTASDNHQGYSAHSPTNDLGVITPTAAIASLPYTPEKSMAAIKHYYYKLGDRLWGPYGFHDAFNATQNWWADSYIAIDQGPIICMIENYRTGLLWDLFMSAPEVQNGMDKLGFRYQ